MPLLVLLFQPNNSNEVLTNYTTATIGTVTAPENHVHQKYLVYILKSLMQN